MGRGQPCKQPGKLTRSLGLRKLQFAALAWSRGLIARGSKNIEDDGLDGRDSGVHEKAALSRVLLQGVEPLLKCRSDVLAAQAGQASHRAVNNKNVECPYPLNVAVFKTQLMGVCASRSDDAL